MLEQVEKRQIVRVLDETSWVIEGDRGAAKVLDLYPNTLCSRMKKLGIERTSMRATGAGAVREGERSVPNLSTEVRDNTTARSITFSSSRMLPGQS